jgi:hypothetical protein
LTLRAGPAAAEHPENPQALAQQDNPAATWADPVPVHWTYRLVASGGFSSHLFEQQRPTRNETFSGGLQVLRPIRIGDLTYLSVGGQIGYGALQAGRCSTALTCPEDDGWCSCDDELGNWTASGVIYGLSAGFGFKMSPGKPYVLFWLPMIRVMSLAGSVGGNSHCDQLYGAAACEGTAKANAILTAGPEWDLVHSGPFGCTFGIGIGTVVGDLASRDGVRPLYTVHFGYGASQLGQ